MDTIKIPKDQVEILEETEKAYFVRIKYAEKQPMNIDNNLLLRKVDCENWINPTIAFWVPKKLFYENSEDYKVAKFYIEKEVNKYSEYAFRILKFKIKLKDLGI